MSGHLGKTRRWLALVALILVGGCLQGREYLRGTLPDRHCCEDMEKEGEDVG